MSTLPHELQVGKFLSSRNNEIQMLYNEISKSEPFGGLASQQVTRRMRRRAVSHNPKRLPRRLRNAHISQRNKSDNNATGGTLRRPSRNWRRRPGNLLSEYNRRQRIVIWLETHIWHAKRFHMKRVWGHAIPETPTDKCWRQTFRALTRGCVMWDVSYLNLIQISGPKQIILDKLNTLTHIETGNVFEFGPGEFQVTVYNPGFFPCGAVGRLRYFWRPPLDGDDGDLLWLWCHPGYYQQISELLKDIFQLMGKNQDRNASNQMICDTEESVDKVSAIKLEVKSVSPIVMQGCQNVEVTFFENRLNRFRLRGPQTLTMLKHCLPTVDSIHENSVIKSYTEDNNLEDRINKCHELISNGSRGKSGTVLGLITRDPRLTLPAQRGRVPYRNKHETNEPELTPDWNLQTSPLWTSDVRKSVSLHKMSDHDINAARQSGSICQITSSHVPVMIICTDDGWDLVSPPGWAMPFWQCLVYSGAKVAGSKEMIQCQLETGHSDQASVEDTTWGQLESSQRSTEMREKYFRLPPDKRPNFSILGTMSPFTRNWNSLLGSSDWFLLRDKLVLEKLRLGETSKDFPQSCKALVMIKLTVLGKGKLSENTMIYQPLDCDLQNENEFNLEEVSHKDVRESQRKDSKVNHQAKLKQLKRQWKKIKNKKTQLILSSATEDVDVDDKKMEEINVSLSALKGLREEEKDGYKENNEKSWECDDKTGIMNHNSRTLIGWVVTGGYCLSSGGETGLGLVTMDSLTKILETNSWKMLVRQPDNLHYRIVSFSVS